MKQHYKYTSYGVRDETINHIITECSKLAPKCIKLDMTEWEK